LGCCATQQLYYHYYYYELFAQSARREITQAYRERQSVQTFRAGNHSTDLKFDPFFQGGAPK